MKKMGRLVMALFLMIGTTAFVLPDNAKQWLFMDPLGREGIATANPNASKEARALLHYLYQIKGSYTLSGQHNFLEAPTKHSNRVWELTSERPAIVGLELGAIQGQTEQEVRNYRQQVVDTAIAAHRAGSIIAITYHAAMPGECYCWDYVNNGGISEQQFKEIITPGTRQHDEWLADIDEVAVYLKHLREAKVPVLWRPYHEMNGKWFWWGGQPQYSQLWDTMFQRYSQHHQLDNLLWVWSPNASNDFAAPIQSYFVGHLRSDILAIDIYNNDFKQSHHDELWQLSAGKPIAIGELGELPEPSLLSGAQHQYVWFMAWGDELEGKNERDKIVRLYQSPRVLHLNDMQKVSK